jgi:hypothetical protein
MILPSSFRRSSGGLSVSDLIKTCDIICVYNYIPQRASVIPSMLPGTIRHFPELQGVMESIPPLHVAIPSLEQNLPSLLHDIPGSNVSNGMALADAKRARAITTAENFMFSLRVYRGMGEEKV